MMSKLVFEIDEAAELELYDIVDQGLWRSRGSILIHE